MPGVIAHQQRDQRVGAQVASLALAGRDVLGVEIRSFAREQVDQRFAAVATGCSSDDRMSASAVGAGTPS